MCDDRRALPDGSDGAEQGKEPHEDNLIVTGFAEDSKGNDACLAPVLDA
jgi:hypothetical protein